MLLTQETFYRKYGVRLLTQIVAPAMHDLRFLQFPRDSVYHYVSYDGVGDGPTNDDPLLRAAKHPVPTIIPTTLVDLLGHPSRMGGDGQAFVREYFKDHRRMRRVVNVLESIKDRDTPLVVNYAILPHLYRYPAGAFTPYNRWHNLFKTVIFQAGELMKVCKRHHYVFLNAPKVLPSLSQLDHACKQIDVAAVKALREPAGFMLLELWKWFVKHPQGEDSLLRAIDKDKIHLLNFVFIEAGRWCVVNLGVLNGFYRPEGQIGADPEYVINSRLTINGPQMSKRILRMYMSMMEARNAALKAALLKQPEATDDASTKQQTPALTKNQNSVSAPSPASVMGDDVLINTNYINSVSIVDEDELEQLSDDQFNQLVSDQDAEIAQDLSQLETISQAQVQSSAHPSWQEIAAISEVEPLESGVERACERLAMIGAISAAEYRRHIKNAQSYKQLKAPIGDQSLQEFMKIDPQMLAIDPQETLMAADSDTVFDKTMLKSSLNVLTPKYVKQVLHKDIANAAMSVQNAGVSVSGYRVEKTEDILGGYETHILRLQPVIGQPSTIRFKVPIVNEDGTYVSQGTRYLLRKQRGDLPIRKTAPNTVALTSHYGKSFITRGRLNSNSYSHWINNSLMARVLKKDDPLITDAVVKDVFDTSLKAPRVYSACARVVERITVMGRYQLCFDQEKFKKENDIAVAPNRPGVYLGKDVDTGKYLWLDMAGEVILLGDPIENLGSLENLLGFDASSIPIEYSTTRVFGKDIPVGIILGLTMGMERLLAALRVEPRIVPVGQRANITSDEWALRFSDETWVFDRKDRMAQLILGGFLEYERALRAFSAHSFEKRGAYVNLLEINSVGVRYVREIEMMNNMFVDPITRDILVEMKEPTTYQGLLFRANELLLTDDHPDELDPLFMRDKGYERIAGAVYTELVHSLRQHGSSLGKAHLGVQLNPYSVWQRISEDSSKLQVSEINPIAALKDEEAVTFLGDGGRSRLSMTKRTRGYHPNSMGVDSEATVDNSDVAINFYTSADPNYTSLRGLHKPFDKENPNITSLLSTSALLAPASDKDD